MTSIIGALISEPSTFVIREVTGDNHNLTLEGRCLPYRPVSFAGSMRAEFTWYPGNPVATVQMLGAKEEATSINGMWKDRFIRTFTDTGAPVVEGRTGVARFDGAVLDDVRSICRVVDGFRMRGQLLEVGWDEITRHGILTSFKQTWQRREDVEWEMEFQWVSRGEPATPIAFGTDIPQVDIAAKMQAAISTLSTALQSPFALVTTVESQLEASMGVLTSAGAALEDLANKAAAAAMTPMEVAKSTLATFQTIEQEAENIDATLQSRPARALRSAASVADVTQEEALEAEGYKRGARVATRAVRSSAAQQGQELAAATTRQPNIRTVIARQDQDLRDISNQFYGTPTEWRRLADYNHLSGSRLDAGTIVLVPPLNGKW